MTATDAGRLATGLVIADERLRSEVRAQADSLGLAIAAEDAAEIDPRRIRTAGLQLLILDACPARERLDATLQRLKSACPATLIAVLHTAADPELILASLRAGADECIIPPLATGLRTAVGHLHVKLGRQRAAGRVLGVVSAKGGCGATTVACHLALALERQAVQHVLLADLHLHSGLVGFLMGARTPYSLIDAVRNTHRLDQSFFKGLVSSRSPRLDVLPAPDRPALESVTSEPLHKALHTVRSMYGWTILDLGSGFNGVLAAALDDVDDLFVVSTVDLPALYQGRQLVRRLLDSGYARSRLQAILNRLPRQREFTAGELRNLLGLAVLAEVRDAPELSDMYAEGKLAAPDSELGRSMTALAARLAGIQPAPQKRGLLEFFRPSR